MKKIKIPITKNFDKDITNQLGILVIDKNKLPKKSMEFHFEPGFKQNKDGTFELLEISLVPNKPYPGRPIPIAKTWSRKGRCPVCKAHCGSQHRNGCIYKKI